MQICFFNYQQKFTPFKKTSQMSNFQFALTTIYRVFAFAVLSYIFGWTEAMTPTIIDYFKYLTYHGLGLSWLYFITLMFYLTLQYFTIQSNNLKYWLELIYELAISLNVTITILYWFLLFDGADLTKYQEYRSILIHCLPLVFTIIQFFLVQYRFNYERLIVLGLYLVGYMLINIAYTLGIKLVYEIITWKQAKSYVYVTFAIALSLLSFLLLHLLTWKFKNTSLNQQDNEYSDFQWTPQTI